MPGTVFDDMIEPELFNKYVMNRTTERSAFIRSGIMMDASEIVAAQFAGGGRTINMPFFNDLDGDDDVSNEEDIDLSGITTDEDVAVRLMREKAWSATDMAAALSGADPMGAITDLVGDWWVRQDQKRLKALIAGAVSKVPLNTFDISALPVSGADESARKFSSEATIEACGVLGDAQDLMRGIAVHGHTYTRMKRLNLIDFEKPADGGLPIATYHGKAVIVDDGLDVTEGVYETLLFGPGAVAFAQWAPKNSVETEREARVKGGRDNLIHRRHLLQHINGIKWKGTPAKLGPSNAEIANPDNWEQVFHHKKIRIVRYKHKL
jgi:hypothetical protein